MQSTHLTSDKCCWLIESSGPQDPVWNMQVDEERLKNLSSDSICYLRFYEWNAPSVTYGYFVDPEEFFLPDQQLVQLARRPTGGGIIFHLNDLAFSLIVPASHPFYALNSLHSYQAINERVLHAIHQLIPASQLFIPEGVEEAPRGGFCMAKATKFDLIVNGKKVGGAAQRKTKQGLLHQGSICLKMLDQEWLKRVLINGTAIHEEMTKKSFALDVSYTVLKEKIIQSFR